MDLRTHTRYTALLILLTAQLGGAAPAAAKGFITGTVVNEAGQPMPGVEVIADNTLAYDSNLIVYTDAKGHYTIDVRLLPTTWNVTARKALQYQGYDVSVSLLPKNPEVVAGRVGGVRDFVLKPKAVTNSDPYGNLALVLVEPAVGEYSIDFAAVTLTLTPQGKLADGSTGRAHAFKLIRTGSGWAIPNIMWGTYNVQATLNGQPLEVRRRASGLNDFAWKRTYTGGFYQDFYSTQPNMFLEVRTPGGAN